MAIKAIFAVDHWGGMGLRGSLPWPHHREDLQYFKEQTNGHVVVMGRRTWDDPKMPKPLPGRTTVVATRKPLFGYSVTTIQGDLVERVKKLEADNPNKIIWIIGGPEILEVTKDLVEEVHVSHFKGQFTTDTKIDLRKYLSLFRATSAAVSSDKKVIWTTYKNIDLFRP